LDDFFAAHEQHNKPAGFVSELAIRDGLHEPARSGLSSGGGVRKP
jgi:hypothetical protein